MDDCRIALLDDRDYVPPAPAARRAGDGWPRHIGEGWMRGAMAWREAPPPLNTHAGYMYR